MITVTRKGNLIKAEGHTGKKGESLLCCSVSTLMWGLADALDSANLNPSVDEAYGYQEVYCKDCEKAKIIMNSYAKNLKDLATLYPEEIIYKEE